jgi:hypothetical protein
LHKRLPSGCGWPPKYGTSGNIPELTKSRVESTFGTSERFGTTPQFRGLSVQNVRNFSRIWREVSIIGIQGYKYSLFLSYQAVSVNERELLLERNSPLS